MLPSTLTAADLGPDALLNLLRHDDPQGVVSIFVDVALDGRAAGIDIRNRLAELERRVDGEPSTAAALADTLARVAPELSAAVDSGGHGRGRALFVPLSGGEPTRLTTQLRLPNRVVLDERPFIHPLLECVERGRPAGVVLISSERADLLEWRQGELLMLTQRVLERDEPRGRPGPVVATAAGHQQSTPLREQQQRRAHDRGRRFVDEVASTVQDIADRKKWDRLLVSGGGAVTRLLLRSLPRPLRDNVIREPRHLIDLGSMAVQRAVGERLEHHQAELDRRLVERVRSAALAGSDAVLGLSEVAAALNEARVEHLLYDPAVRHVGAMTASGRLVIPPERDPLGEPLLREPRLTERLVERCLATGARITPVEGAAATRLADTGGVAARLRW